MAVQQCYNTVHSLVKNSQSYKGSGRDGTILIKSDHSQDGMRPIDYTISEMEIKIKSPNRGKTVPQESQRRKDQQFYSSEAQPDFLWLRISAIGPTIIA